MKFVPSSAQVSQQVIAVILGALIAAYIISRFPAVQAFIQRNLGGAN